MEIAARPGPAQMRHATAPQPDLRPGLHTCADLEILLALDRRDPSPRPKRGLRHGKLQVVEDLGSVAAKDCVRRHVDGHVQVARGSATRSRLTLAGEADLMPLVDAGGDRDAQLLSLLNAPVAATGLAGSVHHTPLAVAAGAFGDVHHLSENRLAHGPDLAAPAARRARNRRAAGGRAAPATCDAPVEEVELDLAFDAANRLVERDPQVVSKIRAGRPPTVPGAARGATHAGEEGIEQVAESGEAVGERRASAAHVAQPGPPDHVVDLAPLRI